MRRPPRPLRREADVRPSTGPVAFLGVPKLGACKRVRMAARAFFPTLDTGRTAAAPRRSSFLDRRFWH